MKYRTEKSEREENRNSVVLRKQQTIQGLTPLPSRGRTKETIVYANVNSN